MTDLNFTQSNFAVSHEQIVRDCRKSAIDANEEIARHNIQNMFDEALKPIIDQAFKLGYCAAVDDFAIWRDGERFIGCMETNVKEIFDRVNGVKS